MTYCRRIAASAFRRSRRHDLLDDRRCIPWRPLAPAAAALLILLTVAGCAPQSETGDPAGALILAGGRVTTVDGEASGAEAVGIRDGVVAAVGDLEEVREAVGPDAREIDLDGGVVLPAFVDHHVHLLNIGLSLVNAAAGEQEGGGHEEGDAEDAHEEAGGSEAQDKEGERGPGSLHLDLSGATSADDVGRLVGERAARTPSGEWILGKGWSHAAWGRVELPDHEPITAAAPDHPAFLTRSDGHAGWLNATALDRIGIDADTPDPNGGMILRRPDGTPTGVLLERAVEPVIVELPEIGDATVVEAFRRAAEAMAARGVTEVFDAGFLAPPGIVALNADLERYLDLLVRADADSPLPIDIHVMVPAPSRLADAVVANPEEYRALSPRIGVTHLKLFADGALGSRGGSLTRPYADDPDHDGVARMSREEIAGQVERGLDAGLDIATHAIGDAAVARALDVYERTLGERPDLDPRRLRIEHFSVARPEDLERAARLGVVLSVQPNFVWPDDQGRTMEDGRLGPERARRTYAWGTLDRAGARLAGGSDLFTVPFPPLLDFYAAATRRNPSGRPPEGWHPDERLGRGRALKLLTTLYRPGGGNPHTGAIREDAPADLMVLSADPLSVPEDEILDLRVVATLRDGHPTHGLER